jgi:hypothetical protein
VVRKLLLDAAADGTSAPPAAGMERESGKAAGVDDDDGDGGVVHVIQDLVPADVHLPQVR